MLRVYPSGERRFVLERRVRRWRCATIGPANLISLPRAREEARRLIAGLLDMPVTTKGPRTPARPMTKFVAAVRMLALIGCRRSEVLNLRWCDIEDNAIRLRDEKTGPRPVPFGKATRTLIDSLPDPRTPKAFVFPRYAEGRGDWSLIARWRAVCEEAKLGRLRLHDLRHTAASQAVMAGENLPWSAGCSGTEGTRLRRGMSISPTRTWSRRPRRWETSSPKPWVAPARDGEPHWSRTGG